MIVNDSFFIVPDSYSDNLRWQVAYDLSTKTDSTIFNHDFLPVSIFIFQIKEMDVVQLLQKRNYFIFRYFCLLLPFNLYKVLTLVGNFSIASDFYGVIWTSSITRGPL